MRDYNFFESIYEEKKTNELKFIYVGIITTVIVGVMVILYLVNIFKIRGLENSIYEEQQVLNSSEFAKAYEQKTRGEQKLEVLNQYHSGVTSLNDIVVSEDYINTELVKKISNVVPESISFKSMNIDNRVIVMNGTSTTRVNIGELQYNLKELGIFDDIHVSSITSSEDDSANLSFNFNISFKLKEEEKNEN